MIEEQKHNNSTETAILPMQCYVQPFWKHSDIEIYNESNLDTMNRMPDNCIDLTVTSPPYDDLRIYNGYCFDFENVAKELFRVTKQGGVVVWVIGDKTKSGTESGNSFRHALKFMENGWLLNDTMIWVKTNPMPTEASCRYKQTFEYMFVFSKGKPKTFNPLMEDTKTERKYKSNWGRKGDYMISSTGAERKTAKQKVKGNVFYYPISVGGEIGRAHV